MKGLKVIQPGILSLIQDTGRIGQHHNGLTVGGPWTAMHLNGQIDSAQTH